MPDEFIIWWLGFFSKWKMGFDDSVMAINESMGLGLAWVSTLLGEMIQFDAYFQTFWNHHLVSCSKLKQISSPMLEHNTVDRSPELRYGNAWNPILHNYPFDMFGIRVKPPGVYRKLGRLMRNKAGGISVSTETGSERAVCTEGVIDIDQQRGPSIFTSAVSKDFPLGLLKTPPFHEMIDRNHQVLTGHI